MKLYDAAWAPSPRRVRIYLAEKGIEIERVPVDLRRDEQLSDAYLAINPRGAVPALELDDGEVITESAAICRYFEAANPRRRCSAQPRSTSPESNRGRGGSRATAMSPRPTPSAIRCPCSRIAG